MKSESGQVVEEIELIKGEDTYWWGWVFSSVLLYLYGGAIWGDQ